MRFLYSMRRSCSFISLHFNCIVRERGEETYASTPKISSSFFTISLVDSDRLNVLRRSEHRTPPVQALQLLHELVSRVQRNAAPFSGSAGQCLRGDGEELVEDSGELRRVDFLGGGGCGEGEEFAGGSEAADGAGAVVVERENGEWDCHFGCVLD